MKFIKDVGTTFVTRIFSFLFGIATTVILARILEPEGMGIFSLVILFPLMIVTVTTFGIGRSTIYYVAKDKYAFKALIGAILTFSFVICIVSTLIGLIIALFFSDSILPGVPQSLLLMSLLLIPLQLFLYQSLNGILVGMQKINEYNLTVIIHTILLLVLVAFFLLVLGTGIIGAITANLLSLFFAIIIASYWIFKFSGGISFRFDKKILSSLFSFGYKAHLSSIFAFLLLRIDLFMLNFFLNSLVVGFYAISVGIAEKLWMLSQTVSTIVYPKVASMKDKEQKNRFTPIISRNVFFITIIGAFIIFLLSKWLILLLFSEEYLPSIKPLQVILIGIIASSVSRVLGSDIDARGKPVINTYITFVALVTNIILNIILIPKYGIIGAAWATSISYSLNLIVKLFVYCRLSDNSATDVIVPKKSDINLYFEVLNAFKTKVRERGKITDQENTK